MSSHANFKKWDSSSQEHHFVIDSEVGSSHTRQKLERLGMKMNYHNIIRLMITDKKEPSDPLIFDLQSTFELLPYDIAAPEEQKGWKDIISVALVCACLDSSALAIYIILDTTRDNNSIYLPSYP